MLKFTKARKTSRPRKSILLKVDKPRRIIQEYAIDQFGELGARKRAAAARARGLGHDLLPWHARPNDPAGRWNGFCSTCNKAAVVCTDFIEGFPESYGPALTEACTVVEPTEV
jgi:hypothetical protein